MPYTPNADDASAPLEAVLAGTAAEEFRAFKTKVNNFFLASGYFAPLQQQNIEAGMILNISPAAQTDPRILYGIAATVQRNDIAVTVDNPGGVRAVAAQLNAVLGPGLDGLATNISVFGIATEAWTHFTAPSHATLIGAEHSVISQYNANQMPLVGENLTFKNRPDTLYAGAVVQGLGADKYNADSRALQINAQPRSTAGERCGWGRGIVAFTEAFDEYYDTLAGVYKKPVFLDARELSGPNTFNPWTAQNLPGGKQGITSVVAMAEYQSITYDRAQFLRTYCDSKFLTHWFLAKGANPAINPLVGFDYNNSYMVYPAYTTAGAATAGAAALPANPVGFKVEKINGTTYKIPYYAM